MPVAEGNTTKPAVFCLWLNSNFETISPIKPGFLLMLAALRANEVIVNREWKNSQLRHHSYALIQHMLPIALLMLFCLVTTYIWAPPLHR